MEQDLDPVFSEVGSGSASKLSGSATQIFIQVIFYCIVKKLIADNSSLYEHLTLTTVKRY
jgi:hypothetical protein